MWELRWILAGLGVALIAALYAWGRFGQRTIVDAFLPQGRGKAKRPPAAEDGAATTRDGESEAASSQTALRPNKDRPKRRAPEKVIALRLVPKSDEIRAETAILALREAGLRLGKYGIFHLHSTEDVAATIFSVASLVEPGAFDLEHLQESTIPGMSIFMVLPGREDPVLCFDRMVQTARTLAQELDAELFDDRGSSWSIQRERYVREELIEYRLQIARSIN